MTRTWAEFYDSANLKADDLPPEGATATIVSVGPGVLTDEDSTEKHMPVVTFKETKTTWAVNHINRQLLEAMFGKSPDLALGHRVTLFAAPCEVKGQYYGVPSIRVKGSPELDAPMTVEIKLPKRRPFTRELIPTVGRVDSPGDGSSDSSCPTR